MTVSTLQIAAAKAAGLTNVEALAAACDKYDLAFHLGCTILSKETGGLNIYGHDKGGVNTIKGNLVVTEENFKAFRKAIAVPGSTSNGVGPMQITYRGHFPIMEKLGLKAWVPADNIDYGISLIAASYHGQRKAGVNPGQAFKYAACVYNLGKYSATWPYGVTALALSLVWKKRVGVTAPAVPEPPVVVPSKPAQPPLVELPTPTLPRPQKGDRGARVRVNSRGARVTSGGYLTTTRGLNMYLEACRLFRAAGGGTPPEITQGGFNAGGVAASAGTHDREAFDWATKNFTARQRRLWELATWTVGFASWNRVAVPGTWSAHTHGVPKGGDLSDGAQSQVTQFKQSKNGFAGWGAYARIRNTGVADVTWEIYCDTFGVSLSGLVKAFDKRTNTHDVKELQRALSSHLNVDLISDGDPGPQTKAALKKVGPLEAKTLVILDLSVNP